MNRALMVQCLEAFEAVAGPGKKCDAAMAALRKELKKEDEVTALRNANTALVCALDRIHDVLTGQYVDDVALIVNAALKKNALCVKEST